MITKDRRGMGDAHFRYPLYEENQGSPAPFFVLRSPKVLAGREDFSRPLALKFLPHRLRLRRFKLFGSSW